MKQRKIFYFLKTKEEYDYMLASKLIPKRGIVLIESTQEIYRNRVPYSGYGPLKTYFLSLKAELLSLIQDNSEDLSSVVELMNLRIQQDYKDYKVQLNSSIKNISDLVASVNKGLSDSDYYTQNTIIPSLELIQSNIQSLTTKTSSLSSTVNSKIEDIDNFKSSLSGLIEDVRKLGVKHNNDIKDLQDSILTTIMPIITNNLQENLETIKEWVKGYFNQQQMTDNDFRSKVLNIVDLTTLETNFKNLLTNSETKLKDYIDAKVLDINTNGTPSDPNNPSNIIVDPTSSYATLAYVDGKFNLIKAATNVKLGLIKVGDYLTIDSEGRLSVNRSALLSGVSPSSPGNNNNNEGTDWSDTIADIYRKLELIETVNEGDIKLIVLNILKDYSDLFTKLKEGKIDWDEVFHNDGWKSELNSYLSEVGLVKKELNGTITAMWTTLLQSINELDSKVSSINIFGTDDLGNPLSYETLLSQITQQINQDSALASIKTMYVDHLLGKDDEIDFVLSRLNLISSYGETLAEIISENRGNIASLTQTVGEHSSSIEALTSFVGFTAGATFKSEVNKAVAQIFAASGNSDSDIKSAIVASVVGDNSMIELIADRVNVPNSLVAGNNLVNINTFGIKIGDVSNPSIYLNSDGSGYVASLKIHWGIDGSGGIGLDSGITWDSEGNISVNSEKITIPVDGWSIGGGNAYISIGESGYGAFKTAVVNNNENYRCECTLENGGGLTIKYKTTRNGVETGGIVLGRPHNIITPSTFSQDLNFNNRFSIYVKDTALNSWREGYSGNLNGCRFANGICVGPAS